MDGSGLREAFEATVTLLLPHCRVAQDASTKRKAAEIAAGDNVNIRIGPKTGVDLRFHQAAEWKKLSDAEQQQVIYWCNDSLEQIKLQTAQWKKSKKG